MPDTPQKLIETVREALGDLSSYRREAGYNASQSEKEYSALSQLESALGEKTVPSEMLEILTNGNLWDDESREELVKQYMPGFTVK
jgi:hypothetical protein